MTGQERMLSYLPMLLQQSSYLQTLLNAKGQEMDRLRADIEDSYNQTFVDTATWGLVLWEEMLGLRTSPGDLKERRELVKSKIRGYGTATIRTIKNVVQSYSNGDIEVAEDFARLVIIRFVGTRGVPANIDELKVIVRELIPAHLDIQYMFTFFVWDGMDGKQWSWDELDKRKMTWEEWEVMT